MFAWFRHVAALVAGKPKVAIAEGIPALLSSILNRRSCRSFTDEALRDGEIRAILEAGRFAPSAVNLQPWSFITFTAGQWREKFERPLPCGGAYAIIICADITRLQHVMPDFQDTPYVNLCFAIFNAGLAAMNMNIAAESLGIRSIMLSETGRTGLLDVDFLQEALRLPAGVLPLTTLVLGRSAMWLPGIPPRQPWDAVVMSTVYDRDAGSRLADWHAQMFLGFKLTHPLSDFDRQLALYRGKMLRAEETVKKAFAPHARCT